MKNKLPYIFGLVVAAITYIIATQFIFSDKKKIVWDEKDKESPSYYFVSWEDSKGTSVEFYDNGEGFIILNDDDGSDFKYEVGLSDTLLIKDSIDFKKVRYKVYLPNKTEMKMINSTDTFTLYAARSPR